MIRNRLRRPSERTVAGAVAAAAAIVVGLIQFRHGIVHLLDTVSYWSGAQAVADGHPFTSRLAPSFSNFDAIEFVERGGRIPFVDFPVAYPLSAGLLGAVIGVRHAMQAICVLALAAIAWAVVAGARKETTRPRLFLLAAIGVLVVLMPTARCVTQGALSEPLFCAVAVWFVVSLARFREGASFRPVAILGATLGLLRFIGGPLVVMAAWEHHRRHRDPRKAIGIAVAMIAPTATNAAWAAMSGGGHNAGWRGLQGNDVSFLVRSIGGWFDSRQGDLRRTYFSLDGTSWWSWLVALLWLGAIVVALIGMIRKHGKFPAPAELALVASGLITSGLVLGMLGFDALVTPDNRLMMPSGVLALFALAWIMNDRVDSLPSRLRLVVPILVVVWAVLAVRPQDVGERFSDEKGVPAYSMVAAASDASVVISNDADAIHWDTGIPAAYAPMAVQPLTGEVIDEAALYRDLSCVLLRNNGLIVLSATETFASVNLRLLENEIKEGRLVHEASNGASVYRATDVACE